MKRSIVGVIILILFSLTLTACTPPGYTEAKKDQVTKEHTDEAKQWFEQNLPNAKVRHSEAHADYPNLYAAIEGSYKYEGNKYEYVYDYYNGDMYLGYEFEKAKEIAADAMREYFGDNVRAINLEPQEFSFYTKCENDKGGEYGSAEEGAIILCDNLRVLPAGSDPTKYANIMLTEGLENPSVAFAKMYVDEIPEYNRQALEQFKGIRYQIFTKPVDFDFDGIYRVSYSFDKAEYEHLKLTEIKDGVYAGYYCTEEFLFDDDSGVEIPKDSGFDETSEFIKDNKDGTYTFRLPGTEGILIVISKKKASVSRIRSYKDGSKEKVVFDEWPGLESPFGKDYKRFIYDINFPVSKYRIYYDHVSSNKKKEYVITID